MKDTRVETVYLTGSDISLFNRNGYTVSNGPVEVRKSLKELLALNLQGVVKDTTLAQLPEDTSEPKEPTLFRITDTEKDFNFLNTALEKQIKNRYYLTFVMVIDENPIAFSPSICISDNIGLLDANVYVKMDQEKWSGIPIYIFRDKLGLERTISKLKKRMQVFRDMTQLKTADTTTEWQKLI